MSPDAKELPSLESAPRAIARAAALGALAGAAIGLAESAKVLATSDVRYVQWGCKLIALGGVGYALLGALLAVPCALFALALFGRPQHRAAPPSACAGLGVALSLVAFAGTGWISALLTLPAALAATALWLALRELLAWWPMATQTRTWWALLGLGSSISIAIVAYRWAVGATQWVAYALVAMNLLAAGAAVVGRRAPHAASAGALALIVLVAGSHPERRVPEISTAGQTDVLIVSVDTLRADHVHCYGAETAVTPTFDRLADEGVLFEDATSQANTTGPSHTTILSGLYPAEHGALSNGVRVSHRVKTLADVLSRTHSTAAFVSGFTLVEEASGLAQRFDWYDDQMFAWSFLPRVTERLHLVGAVIRVAEQRGYEVRRADRPANETVDAAIRWLDSRGDEPLFTFVHLYDPHAPYEPPAEYAMLHDANYERGVNWYELDTREREALVSDPAAVERMKALYAGEISFADAQVGRLLDALRASGRLDKTLVVLTSDHGEGLGSHDYWFDHGTYLYDEELHVPLILRFPGAAHAGTRVKGQVRSLDIAATVLDVLGLESLLATSGASLVPLAKRLPDERERPSFAIGDISGDVSGFGIEGRRLSLRAKGHKLIWSSSHWLDTTRMPGREEFYRLETDPGELRDLRVDQHVPFMPFDDMHEDLGAWRDATANVRANQEIGNDVVEQLRKLGYL